MLLFLFTELCARYYEDLFARDAKTPTVVNVASKAYRAVCSMTIVGSFAIFNFWLLIPSSLCPRLVDQHSSSSFLHCSHTRRLSVKPGTYTAKLSYNGGGQTVANWVVRNPATHRKAKNVLFFIGDGGY